MVKTKIKIGFECTDNWSRQEFRALIFKLKDQPEFFSDNLETDIYLISNDDSTAYIYRISEQLGLNNNHVFVTNFTDDKVNKINELGIDIYFTNTQHEFLVIDSESDCKPVLINSIPNKYDSTFNYEVKFDFILRELLGEEPFGTG